MAKRRAAAGTAEKLKREGEYGYEPVKSRSQYEDVAIVRGSKSGTTWKILRHKETGTIKCSCPAFIFKPERDDKGRKVCKHLRAYYDAPEELDAEFLDAESVAKRERAEAERAALEAQKAARESQAIGWLLAAANLTTLNGPGSRSVRTRLYERYWIEMGRALAPIIFANIDAASLAAPVVATPAPRPAGLARPRQLRIVELDD